MSEKRRGLGRGLGALIPSSPSLSSADNPDKASSSTATLTRPDGAGEIEVVGVELPAQATSGGETGPTRDEIKSATSHNIVVDLPSLDAGTDAASQQRESTSAMEHDSSDGHGSHETPTDLVSVPGVYFAELAVETVQPNPRQPRVVFDEEELAELVHSIREIGVLQPIVVRPTSGTRADEAAFEIVMGERRWRATQAAGLPTIPAIVRETTDDDLLRDALLENLHRSQLNPLEEAAAYQQLLEDFGCTHEELAQRIGRSRPQISNTIRLLRLPPVVQRRVAAGVLSAGHARALLGLEDSAAMEALAQRIVAEGLSVRAVEEVVSLGETPPGSRTARRRPRAGGHRAALDDLATRLGDRFDTRVGISLGQRKGKLTIEFASVEDLNRIIAMIDPHEQGAFSGRN